MKKVCINCSYVDLHDYDDFLGIAYCCIDGYIMHDPITRKCIYPEKFKYEDHDDKKFLAGSY